MMRTANRCCGWAAVLIVVGVIIAIYGTDWYVTTASGRGFDEQLTAEITNYAITTCRFVAGPLAAALIGAGIVLRTPAPRFEEDSDSKD